MSSIFERQLRIWGDIGQSRLEKSICIVKSSCGFKNNKLIASLLTSLQLAGAKKIIPYADSSDLSELIDQEEDIASSTRQLISIVYSENSSERIPSHPPSVPALPKEIADARLVTFTIIASRTSPVIVILTELHRPLLILNHHDKSIPPFALSELPLSNLCSKWISETSCEGSTKTLEENLPRLPWMLILFYCQRKLKDRGEEVTDKGLKEELKKISCHPDCLKEARLHMYWILKEPSLSDLIEKLNSDYHDMAELREKLQELGRFPVFGDLDIDEICDTEIWTELYELLLSLAEADQAKLKLDPFLRRKGLGCLNVSEALDVVASEGYILPIFRESILRSIHQNEKIASLAINTEHLLSSVLSPERFHNVNNTILHGLISIAKFLDSKAFGKSELELAAMIKSEYPELADEPCAINFSLQTEFRVIFDTIVGASISTEVLKAMTQQFALDSGIVIFE